MVAIFFALISYVGWGAGDIFVGLSSRKLGSLVTTFWIYGLGALLPIICIPFVFNSLAQITYLSFSISVILGVLMAAAGLAFIEGLRVGNASIVGTIAGSFTSIVVVLSVIFLNETLFANQIVLILIIFAGVILSSLNLKDLSGGNLLNKGTGLALFAMVGWGISFTLIKIPIREIGWFWPAYIEGIVAFLIFLVLILRKKTSIALDRRNFLIVFLGALLPTLGFYSFNYAISIGQTSIVAPIAGSSITLFVLLSRFVFKDRLNKQQIAGIIITICGIVLLAILS